MTQRTPHLSLPIDFTAAGMGVAFVPLSGRHRRPESVRFVCLQWLDPRVERGSETRRDAPGRVVTNLLIVVQGFDDASAS